MPKHGDIRLMLISLVLVTTLSGMVAAWTWALGQFRSGRPLLAEPKPRVVPWGAGSVLLVFLTWLAVNVGVALVWFASLALIGVRSAHRPPTLAEQMTVVSLINGVLLVLVPAILRLTAGATLADLGIEGRDLPGQARAGTLGFLLAAPVVYLLNLLAVLVWEQNKHPLEQLITAEPTAEMSYLAVLSAVLLAPAAEELIFRGVIQSWLTQMFHRPDIVEDAGGPSPAGDPAPIGAVESSDRTTPVGTRSEGLPGPGTGPEEAGEVRGDSPAPGEPTARPRGLPPWLGPPAPALRGPFGPSSMAPIVITSAGFAAVHLPQWPAPLAIFFLSVGLGMVYQRTGSLFASFLMHALFNGFSTMMLFQEVLLGHPADPKVAPTAIYLSSAAPCPASDGLPSVPRPCGVRFRFNRDSTIFSVGAGIGCG